MGIPKVKTKILSLTILIGLQFVFATSGDCQAWVASKGTGAFSISYINNLDNKEYFGHGETYIMIPPDPICSGVLGFSEQYCQQVPPTGLQVSDFGRLRTQGVYFDVAYSVTDKLGLTISIPYLAPKYDAPAEETSTYFSAHHFPDGSVPLDDGRYHGFFQELAFRARYNVAMHPFLITPFVQYNQPSNGYPTFSHAIVGRNVNSIAFGSYFGKTLGGFLSNAYVQGDYAFAFDEKVLDISRHRSQFEGEVGYFITPEVRAFTTFSAQITHGGLDGPQEIGLPFYTNPQFVHHSQITRDNYADIAFGAQYSISNRMDVYGLVQHMIIGRNLHALKYGLTFGMSWGWGGSPQRPCHC
jgi:hypothetical protein